jgi:membrane-associated protease RseP (regulator of RpoE activity)
MLKLRSIVKSFSISAAVLVLCTPLLLNAQPCCGEEKDSEKVCTKVCEKSGYLGITGSDLSEGVKKALNIESGAVVETVAGDSPAEKAGFKVGDVIVEIDGQKVSDFEALRKIVVVKPNEKVKIVMFRDSKKIAKDVILGEKEAKEIKLEMNLPDIDLNIENFKDMLGKGTTELQKQIEELKIEVEKLKAEVEKLKAK